MKPADVLIRVKPRTVWDAEVAERASGRVLTRKSGLATEAEGTAWGLAQLDRVCGKKANKRLEGR